MLSRQLSPQKKSREESSGEGSGVEILANRPYSDGPGGSGQYTHKIYHVGSHIPSWFRALLPKAALQVEEESWNAYPYTRTRWDLVELKGGLQGRLCHRAQPHPCMSPRYTCPFVEKFSIEIETYYRPDAGQQTNVFNLSAAEKRQRILGAYGRRESGSRRWAGPDACRGSHAVLPELGVWVCCSAPGAQLPCWLQGLSVCNTLGFALSAGPRVLGTAIEGPQQGKAPVPQAPCPELPACFLGSAARVRIKDVLGGNFVLCVLPLPVYLFVALPFPVPAFSPLLPCPSPCPTQSGTALPSQPLSGCAWEHAPGSCRAFRISWSRGSWRSVSPFSHPLP